MTSKSEARIKTGKILRIEFKKGDAIVAVQFGEVKV